MFYNCENSIKPRQLALSQLLRCISENNVPVTTNIRQFQLIIVF